MDVLLGNSSIFMGHGFHGYVKKPEGIFSDDPSCFADPIPKKSDASSACQQRLDTSGVPSRPGTMENMAVMAVPDLFLW